MQLTLKQALLNMFSCGGATQQPQVMETHNIFYVTLVTKSIYIYIYF